MVKSIVLLSGGLDSATCLALAVKLHGAENVMALNMFYGQRHDREILSARKVAAWYGVELLELPIDNVMRYSNSAMLAHSTEDVPDGTYDEQKADGMVKTYVPYRNGVLLSIAASIAYSMGFDQVIYGAHMDDVASDAYPDCSMAFADAQADAIYEGTGEQVELWSPFIHLTKAEIVKRGLELGVPYELTWSCYKGGLEPCHTCATCIDREEAFRANGAEDPLCRKSQTHKK